MIRPNEPTGLKATQESAMLDVGYRLIQTQTVNQYGEVIQEWVRAENSTICGLEMNRGSERKGSQFTEVEHDAILRLPQGFEIDEKDRFEITIFRFEPFSKIYEIASPAQHGISATRVYLREMEM